MHILLVRKLNISKYDFNVLHFLTDQTNFRGSISFLNGKTFTFELDGGIQGRITRIDDNLARIYFGLLDIAGDFIPAPVPRQLTLHNVVNDENVPVLGNEMFLMWARNYELRQDGEAVIYFYNQRQQAIGTLLACEVLEN